MFIVPCRPIQWTVAPAAIRPDAEQMAPAAKRGLPDGSCCGLICFAFPTVFVLNDPREQSLSFIQDLVVQIFFVAS